MKKIDYQAPEMEVIELQMKGSVLLETSTDQPGFDPEPVDE